jgi:hypothetical protein
MFNNDNDELYRSYLLARRVKRVLILLLLIGAIAVLLNKLNAQEVERAKTTSVQKVKKFGTKYRVCVVTESGKSYRTIYNAHCYTCTVNVPQRWTVVTKKNRSFIKAEE